MSQLLTLINQFRSQAQTCSGKTMPAVPALSWNSALANAAGRHSGDMALNNFFSHQGSDGSVPGVRISAAGYSFSYWAENIAAGSSSSAGAFGQWRDSTSGHCEAMMSATATDVGASCMSRQGTMYTYYWTLNFGRPR
jgi:uncharacterized protein YkwD